MTYLEEENLRLEDKCRTTRSAYNDKCAEYERLKKKYDVLVEDYNELMESYNRALSVMTSTNNMEVF